MKRKIIKHNYLYTHLTYNTSTYLYTYIREQINITPNPSVKINGTSMQIKKTVERWKRNTNINEKNLIGQKY